jgi:hypothetical protein
VWNEKEVGKVLRDALASLASAGLCYRSNDRIKFIFLPFLFSAHVVLHCVAADDCIRVDRRVDT